MSDAGPAGSPGRSLTLDLAFTKTRGKPANGWLADAPADRQPCCNHSGVDSIYIDDVDKGDIEESVMGERPLGEVEHMVLLAVLRLSDGAFALEVLRELDRAAGHVVSRGTLYKTLERLEMKGLLDWELEAGSPARGGHPRRRFLVTEPGLAALREARTRLQNLWTGVTGILEADQ